MGLGLFVFIAATVVIAWNVAVTRFVNEESTVLLCIIIFWSKSAA